MIVRFFAQTRRQTGCAETEIAVEQPIDADELWRRLEKMFPGIAGTRTGTRLARNHEFARADAVFAGHDEVALIPPVSGG